MTTVSPEIVKRVEDKILEVMDLLQRRFPSVVLKIPTYKFGQLGTRGGIAHLLQNQFSLNSDFLKNHLEDMINQTTPHEVAHLVAFQVYGRLERGHGRFWKGIMHNLAPLGVKVSRCHEYSLEGVKRRRVAKPYEYVCKCMTHNVTINLHTKMQKGRTYTCRKCRTRLVLKGLDGLNLSKAA